MRILIADDSSLCRKTLKKTLESWNYDVVETCDGRQARQVLDAKDAPRLAILDWHMPGWDGPDLCRRLRKRTGPYCYAILLTSNNDHRRLIEGLKAGADDYMSKPFDPAELEQRLRAGKRIIELQDRLLAAQSDLRIQATHDALTGCWNRRAILEILDRELNRSTRRLNPISIIIADLDHFKRVNDTHGHPAGDAVLAATVKTLKSAVRAYDSVGRYGGEEFLLVIPNADIRAATGLAERLRRLVASGTIQTAGQELTVTMSCGVCSSEMLTDLSAETLIRLADIALYDAKEAGRNCVRHIAGATLTPASKS